MGGVSRRGAGQQMRHRLLRGIGSDGASCRTDEIKAEKPAWACLVSS